MSTGSESVSPALNLEKCSVVLLDVAGTTTSINFVKETLFPFVIKQAEEFLKAQWEDEVVKEAVKSLKDAELNLADATAAVKELTEQNSENKGLKTIQGLIYKKGYEAGDLKAHVFSDVAKSLETWAKLKKIAIYSTGSVESQKLLFSHTVEGDVSSHVSKYFDQSVGNKTESESYEKIAKDLEVKTEEIVFVTDNPKEAEAAKTAGVVSVLVKRDGNEEFQGETEKTFPIVSSFTEIVFENPAKRKNEDETVPTEEQPPSKLAKTDTKDEKTVDTEPAPETDEKMEVDVPVEPKPETKPEKPEETPKDTEKTETEPTEDKTEKPAEPESVTEKETPMEASTSVAEAEKPETKTEKPEETEEKKEETAKTEEEPKEKKSEIIEAAVEEKTEKMETEATKVAEKEEKIETKKEEAKETASETIEAENKQEEITCEKKEPNTNESKEEKVTEKKEESKEEKVVEKKEENTEEKVTEKKDETANSKVEGTTETKTESAPAKTEETTPEEKAEESTTTANGTEKSEDTVESCPKETPEASSSEAEPKAETSKDGKENKSELANGVENGSASVAEAVNGDVEEKQNGESKSEGSEDKAEDIKVKKIEESAESTPAVSVEV